MDHDPRSHSELRRVVLNWPSVGVLARIVTPGGWLPKRGLAGSPIGRLSVQVKLRSGHQLRCRADELEGFWASFIDRECEVPGMDWGSVHTIFDVGANVGAATLWFSEVAPRAEIVALEPAPETFRSLTLNMKENGLGTRVRAMQVALGGAPGVGRIVPGIASGATHVSQTGAGPEVPIITLESLLRSTAVAEVDLMKLDCEGAEYSSLLHASPTALRRIRVMVGEYHLDPTHTAEDIRRVLIDAGFDVGLRPRTEPAPRNLGDAAGFFVARRTSFPRDSESGDLPRHS